MSIRFLLDENIPYALIEALEERDFAVEHLKRIGRQGIRIGEVYEIAQNGEGEKHSGAITNDAEFGLDSIEIMCIIRCVIIEGVAKWVICFDDRF